jgi:outer membrane protein OmpA-like peptidoglycan-associated protein
MTLSEKRAKEVMNTLITEYGVPKEQVKAYGVASLTPVTSNRTDEGKARNRRVEIVEQ